MLTNDVVSFEQPGPVLCTEQLDPEGFFLGQGKVMEFVIVIGQRILWRT